jgi:uncharacterized membrane protein YkvA (DUF1232 family)
MSATSWLLRPSLLRLLISHARLAIRLLREPHVGLLRKAVPVLAVAYLISPLDFVPDFIPVLGELDDLGMLLVSLEGFLKICPPDVVAFHRAAIEEGRPYSPMPATSRVIEAEWRHEEV